MVDKVKKLILQGEFLEANKYLPTIDYEALRVILFNIGDEEKSICAYTFVVFLLLQHESVQYHTLAAEMIMHNFPYIEGSYQTGLFHARRSIELNPEDIDLEEMLLFFHSLPDKLVGDDEARTIAGRVLARKKNSIPAQRVLFGDREILEQLEKEKNKVNK